MIKTPPHLADLFKQHPDITQSIIPLLKHPNATLHPTTPAITIIYTQQEIQDTRDPNISQLLPDLPYNTPIPKRLYKLLKKYNPT